MSRTLLPATFLAALLVACSFRTPPPPGATGPEIYKLQNCANCHGKEAEGKSLGPPLRQLSRHWTAAELAGFLAEPKPFIAKDARLEELSGSYSSDMSSYANLNDEQRLVLATWLLSL